MTYPPGVTLTEGAPRKILRVIVATNDCTFAANVGGSNEITHRTFDLECSPELVAYLDEIKPANGYVSRWIEGVEVREP